MAMYSWVMAETFYRFHWADCPELTAANAWSALWGADRSADGSQTRCQTCGGDGDGGTGDDGRCDDCGGEGWHDALPGYSACSTPAELAAYFATRGEPADGRVVVFTGRRAGTGFDGEPLAIPERVLRTMTWAEFTASLA